MEFKNKYQKEKQKYLKLKQKGGDVNVNRSYRESYKNMAKKFNSTQFHDKGSNNIWMEKIPSEKFEGINNETNFHEKLKEILNNRNKLRQNNLKNLSSFNHAQGNDDDYILNIDFVNDFFINLFRGTTNKFLYPVGKQYEYPDDVAIYSQIVKSANNGDDDGGDENDVQKIGKKVGQRGQEIKHFMFF